MYAVAYVCVCVCVRERERENILCSFRGAEYTSKPFEVYHYLLVSLKLYIYIYIYIFIYMCVSTSANTNTGQSMVQSTRYVEGILINREACGCIFNVILLTVF